MNRRLALFVAIVGGAIVGYVAFLVIAGAVLGILWLYVFGDDPWPQLSDYVIGTVMLIGGAACWFICGRLIWEWVRPRT